MLCTKIVLISTFQLSETISHDASIITVEGQEDTDIPNPFPFPTHYRSDIELGLKQENMSALAFTKFVTRIANVMFLYKRYPKKGDYESVAEQIVTRYPFMKSPLQRTVSNVIIFDFIVSELCHVIIIIFRDT